MSNIYNHRSLAPNAAPPQQQPAPPTNASTARLNDLLDFVKHEFDVIGSEAGQLKGQRDEFEHRIGQQVNEVQMMQQHIMDLESRHTSMAQQYEEEIKRLRALLDARGGAPTDAIMPAGPSGVQQPPHLPTATQGGPPSIAPPPGSAGNPPRSGAPFGAPPGSDYRAGPPSNGGYEREMLPPGPDARMGSGGGGGGGGPPGGPGPGPGGPPRGESRNERERGAPSNGSEGSVKRMRTEQERYEAPPSPGEMKKEDRMGQSPYVQHMQGPPGGYGPGAPGGGRDMDMASPGPGPAAGNASLANLSDMDPDDIPKELKKEGSDWMAIFNPKVKRVLDVNLVHTLMHESVVCCVRFSPDGKYLATGCNRSAQIYDTKTGAKTCVLSEPTSKKGDLYIRSVCFSPDGQFLATGAEDRQIRIWDIAKKKVKHLFSGHKQEIYSLDFSRDGRIIASGSGDKSVRIWDVQSGKCLHVLYTSPNAEHGPSEAGVTSVSISADNRLVAAGALDTLVRVWDTKTGQQLEKLKGHKDSIYSVSFAPDGKSLISGSLDKTLKLWDLTETCRLLDSHGATEEERTGNATCATTLLGHKDYVLSVSCSPDGQWVASGSKDRGVQFWDPRSGQAQFVLSGHKNSVIAINLSPAGNLLATGSGDFNARIWSYERIAE